MASRALTPLLRRSIVQARSSALASRGGSPPLPAFARIPPPKEPLVENHDALFDDACAPELALDFDCQNVSTAEGIGSWLIGIGCFATLFFAVSYIEVPESRNPALTRGESDDIVVPPTQHD